LHCSASASKTSKKEMSPEELSRFVRYVVEEAGVFSVGISGGEPLLREDTLGILDYLSANGIDSKIFTNSTLITDEIAKRLSEQKCLKGLVSTSIDGPDASVHDALRGSGAFKSAVRGIERLVKNDVMISATCVVSKLNINILPAIAELAENLGIEHLGFSHVGLVGYARDNSNLFALTNREIDYAYDVVLSLAKKHKIVDGGPIMEWPKGTVAMLEENPEKLNTAKPIGQRLASCDICKETVTITPDGWMVPCNKFWDYKIGNVLKEDFLDLYRKSPRTLAIRNLANKRSHELDGCKNCTYASFCAGGCRAEAYSLSGSLMAPDKFRCIKHYKESSKDSPWCHG